jgi:hypothetical protein
MVASKPFALEPFAAYAVEMATGCKIRLAVIKAVQPRKSERSM